MLSHKTIHEVATPDMRAEASATSRAARRNELFTESWNTWAQRWILGTAYALRPGSIATFPQLVVHTLADVLRGGTRVPDPQRTKPTPDTFGGICRDFSATTVLAATRLGFFPWCHCGPLKWWTRKQRMVLFFGEHHIAKRLRRDMKKAPYRITFDQAFEEVIAACAGHRSYNRHSLTWITPTIMRVYTDLFDQGHAHSFEVWDADGNLVGGGYGLSVGRVFMTESQFSLAPNTSKMGFAVLNYHLAKWGYVVNDGKDFTPTIEPMGFRLIPREEYLSILQDNASGEHPGPWAVEATLAEVAEWDPTGASSSTTPPKKAKPAKQAA